MQVLAIPGRCFGTKGEQIGQILVRFMEVRRLDLWGFMTDHFFAEHILQVEYIGMKVVQNGQTLEGWVIQSPSGLWELIMEIYMQVQMALVQVIFIALIILGVGHWWRRAHPRSMWRCPR